MVSATRVEVEGGCYSDCSHVGLDVNHLLHDNVGHKIEHGLVADFSVHDLSRKITENYATTNFNLSPFDPSNQISTPSQLDCICIYYSIVPMLQGAVNNN